MAFHDLPLILQCLCNMAVDNDDKHCPDHRHGPQNPYDIRRTRVRPVIEKIVESIAQNVGNRGLGLPEFSDELLESGTCRHVVEADIFIFKGPSRSPYLERNSSQSHAQKSFEPNYLRGREM
ncbi:hypothetical protein BKA67DRAFT_534984 [Truncatella angustata]|uniref:Uncharacterized protein n=1 Tax=Truncatella angustata TaxID=152316 RepID=A0A9P8UPR1_9PEZI|nr:uncharacterized protein BKA67DRAFT_534984 [Truncatella angustata]KAH6656087.1 hypothetical protein BKA67DRAFT_534984 [Truncatella angustata]